MENDRERERGIAAVKMDALRRYCGISRSGRIRNEVIKRKTKISETVEEKYRDEKDESSFGMDM